MEPAKPIAEIVSGLLTAMPGPPTRASIPNHTILKRFAKMAQFEIGHDQQLERMFVEAQLFAASINFTRPYWLLLCGKTGVGKTHLAHKIFQQFIAQNRFQLRLDSVRNRIVGNTAMWIDWRKLCKDLRGAAAAWEIIDDIVTEWFVVIDDAAASRDNTGFVTDALDQIVAGREGKWTLITSNLTLQDMASQLDVRIADRMLRNGGVVVEVDTVSYNQRRK